MCFFNSEFFDSVLERGSYKIDDIHILIKENSNINTFFKSCMVHEKDDVGIYLLTLGKLPNEDYLDDNPDVKKYVDKLKNKLDL
jgi:hypothetical protein